MPILKENVLKKTEYRYRISFLFFVNFSQAFQLSKVILKFNKKKLRKAKIKLKCFLWYWKPIFFSNNFDPSYSIWRFCQISNRFHIEWKSLKTFTIQYVSFRHLKKWNATSLLHFNFSCTMLLNHNNKW